jgi:hypothetical protein
MEELVQIRLVVAYLLLGLLFDRENRGNNFLRNVSGIQPNYKPLLPAEDRTLYTVMNLRMLRPRPPTSSGRSSLNKSINVGQLVSCA